MSEPVSDQDIQGLIYQNKIKYQYFASSTYETTDAAYLFDNNVETHFCSNFLENQFIQIDFLDSTIKLNYYTFRVGEYGNDYPISWLVTAFNGNNWINLSYVSNSELNANAQIKVFEITNNNNQYISSIRFTMTDVNSHGNYAFCLADLDLFGDIQSNLYKFYYTKDNKSLFFQLKFFSLGLSF